MYFSRVQSLKYIVPLSLLYMQHHTISKLFIKILNRINTLRPRRNFGHFADIVKCIFLNENAWISLKILLKFVHKVWINILALVQIMAWRRPGDKLLSEPMMVNLLTHICVTQPQWVNTLRQRQNGSHFVEDLFNCNFLNKNVLLRSPKKYYKIVFILKYYNSWCPGDGIWVNQSITWTNVDLSSEGHCGIYKKRSWT